MWHDLLFHGAEDDSVIFLCHYVCVSLWPGLEIERERVIALSAAWNALKGWGLVGFFCTYFSGWRCQFHCIYIELFHLFRITNPVNTNTDSCSPKIEIAASNLFLWNCLKNCRAVNQKLPSHPSKCTMHAIIVPCYSIIHCLWSSSRICFRMTLLQSVSVCQLKQRLLQINK